MNWRRPFKVQFTGLREQKASEQGPATRSVWEARRDSFCPMDFGTQEEYSWKKIDYIVLLPVSKEKRNEK
jgi:hypothetical protein